MARSARSARDKPPLAAATPLWEKVATLACGVVGIGTILALVTLNPDPTEAQWKTYWAVLALTVACIGALLPGFLEIRYRSVLRAGGALACFTLVLYSSGQIKGLGGPTRDELSAQGTTLLHEAALDRGVLGPASLDRLKQAKALFKTAQDGAGQAMADFRICEALYSLGEFQQVLAPCTDAQHEIDLATQLSEIKRLKLLAPATLYFFSAQDRVHVTLDTPLGIRQALDYAVATKDLHFVVSFSLQAANALFENNGGAGSLSSWAYVQALLAMGTFDLNSLTDLDFVAQSIPSVLRAALIDDIVGKAETPATLECGNLRTDILMAFDNFDMWVQKTQWRGTHPRDQTKKMWNASRCVSQLHSTAI